MASGGDAEGELRCMRDGIRFRIARLADSAAVGARRQSPMALLVVLCSSALAPVALAAAGAAGAVGVATAGMLGSVGANVLSGVVTDVVDRLRAASDPGTHSVEHVERQIQRQIEGLLAADADQAGRMHREMADLLSRIGAVQVVLDATVASGNEEIRVLIIDALVTLDREFEAFHGLLTNAAEAISEIGPVWG